MKNGSSPSKEHVREVLFRLLSEIGQIPPDRLTRGACMDDSLRMESVAFIEIQVALEEELDIEIDPVEILELNELNAIIEYLYERTRVG